MLPSPPPLVLGAAGGVEAGGGIGVAGAVEGAGFGVRAGGTLVGEIGAAGPRPAVGEARAGFAGAGLSCPAHAGQDMAASSITQKTGKRRAKRCDMAWRLSLRSIFGFNIARRFVPCFSLHCNISMRENASTCFFARNQRIIACRRQFVAPHALGSNGLRRGHACGSAAKRAG